MAVRQIEKLTLVPVAGDAPVSGDVARGGVQSGQVEAVLHEGDGARVATVLGIGSVTPATPERTTRKDTYVPVSGTRVSPRVLAEHVVHQPLGGGSRLNRESLLSGGWSIVDVERRDSELRLFLRPGAPLMSSREHEVLRSVLSGVADREVSLRMGITRQCVCGHLGNGVSKIGTESRFTALQAWRLLCEAEKGRLGRAMIAEIPHGDDGPLISLRLNIPPRPEIEVRLSSAETHVAWLVCDGLSNRDIAVARGTAERTVANQVASIFNKLDVCRRFELAQFLLGLR